MNTNKEVPAADVIRIILQFLKEQGLHQSFQTLQDETEIALNAVDNTDQFITDIHSGRWDVVLKTVTTLRLPAPKLTDLYEQIVLEMIELHETDVARSILRGSEPLQQLRLADESSSDRYSRLEGLLTKSSYEAREFYPKGESRDARRHAIAKSIRDELNIVPQSRLLALLNQAMKFQQYKGMLPPGTQFDLFRGTAPVIIEDENFPTKLERTIRFGKQSHAECARFSPDGQYLVTGSVDGFVEVWDYLSGKINMELQYQADELFMMHDHSVLCIAFSRDSDLLASGDKEGCLKVWHIRTGKCVKRFDQAHSKAVTCVTFTRDAQKVLTGSFDGTVRLHGLVSGKTLKIFRGHGSYVNEVMFNSEGTLVYSGSSDGTVKVWDAKTADCVHTLKPTNTGAADITINAICWSPKSADQMMVCARSPTLFRMSLKGEIIKTYLSGKEKGGDFVNVSTSPRGDFVYALCEDMHLYCFKYDTAELLHKMKVADKELIGLSHHPHKNLLATYAEDGTVQLWKP